MQVLTFQHEHENYCLNIEDVSAVLQHVEVLSLPRVPALFEGIFQLRGKIITLFNFERHLGVADSERESQILVFSEPRSHFAMRVPGLIEAMTLHSDPKDLTGQETKVSPFLEAIVYDGHEIYHLLSASRIFSRVGMVLKEQLPAVAEAADQKDGGTH